MKADDSEHSGRVASGDGGGERDRRRRSDFAARSTRGMTIATLSMKSRRGRP
jgi:hypothetical protein